MLDEIGRLREIAFRAVGEGTGRARDLDVFDQTYRHLFVWDRQRHEIAGAYRLGATDEILAASGTAGLYTRTLFDYGDALLTQLGPALELGRSFVASRLAALLIAHLCPISSLFAPCDPGAALRQSVVLQRGQATSPSDWWRRP